MNASDPQNDRELLLEIHHDVKELKSNMNDLKDVREDVRLWRRITQSILWLIGVTGAALGIFVDWKDIIK